MIECIMLPYTNNHITLHAIFILFGLMMLSDDDDAQGAANAAATSISKNMYDAEEKLKCLSRPNDLCVAIIRHHKECTTFIYFYMGLWGGDAVHHALYTNGTHVFLLFFGNRIGR